MHRLGDNSRKLSGGTQVTNRFSLQDLSDARVLLDELFEEVVEEEGELAGGQAYGSGGNALLALRETEVTFGHPYANLIQLTPDLFAEMNIELDSIQRHQLEDRFDFYYMTLTVSLYPKRGAMFQLVECRLEFGPEGINVPIVHTLFPQSKWRTVLEWGGAMNLGLNANLDWEVGVESDKIQELIQLGEVPKANITTNNELKAHIVVPDYSFKMGRSEIIATGEENSRCSWRIQDPELQETQTVRFVIVFKVPQGTREIELTGLAAAEPKMSWLTTQLDDIFGELSEKFKALFRRRDDERDGKERLPIGAYEKWTLELPRQQD
jgi:hypothetical protein